jgi:DNA-binding PadR family transcriptional regulator
MRRQRYGGPNWSREDHSEEFAAAPGPGFGPPAGPPFGPPFGGPRHRGGRPGTRGRGRGRASRGDVRIAVLLLLRERGGMHGYQLMQEIAERTQGRWSPSAGAIYPTLTQLTDEGLVEVDEVGGRRLASLTASGLNYVDQEKAGWPDPFAVGDAAGADLRDLLAQLHDAVRQLDRAGTEAQRAQAAELLNGTRRAVYRLLAEEPSESADGTSAENSEN